MGERKSGKRFNSRTLLCRSLFFSSRHGSCFFFATFLVKRVRCLEAHRIADRSRANSERCGCGQWRFCCGPNDRRGPCQVSSGGVAALEARSRVMKPAIIQRHNQTRLLLVTFLCIAAILCGCHRKSSQITSKEPIAVQVAKVTVAETKGEDLRYSASVVPYAEVNLTFRSSGYVTGIAQVREPGGRLRDIGAGDYAEQGFTLAHIRREDVQNDVAQAQAQLDSALAQHTKAD